MKKSKQQDWTELPGKLGPDCPECGIGEGHGHQLFCSRAAKQPTNGAGSLATTLAPNVSPPAGSADSVAYQALFSALVSIRSSVDLALAALAMLGGKPTAAPTATDPRVRAMMEQNRKGAGVSFINPADNAKQETASPPTETS